MQRNYRRFFNVFANITRAVQRGEPLEDIAAGIVRHAAEVLAASGSIFWKLDDGGRRQEVVAAYGNPFSSIIDCDYQALERLLAASEGNLVHVDNLRWDEQLAGTPFSCCVDGGSLTVAQASSAGPYRVALAVWSLGEKTLHEDQQDLLVAFAEQGALALYRSLTCDAQDMESLRQIVEGLALALEAKDDQTHGHSLRVGMYARRVALELGLRQEDQQKLYHGGLLHDIGKIGVANTILARLGIPTLSAREKDSVRRHPEIGARILAPLKGLQELQSMVLYHHERFDGTGFPYGLAGTQIPFAARVITVCDAFETMLSGRKHLAGMSLVDAVADLERGVGKQFDPDVVLALFAALDRAPEYFTETGQIPENLGTLLRRLSARIACHRAGQYRARPEVFF